MATIAKRTTTKTPAKKETPAAKPEPKAAEPAQTSRLNFLPKNFIRKPNLTAVREYRPSKMVYLAVAIVALALLVSYKKSWFIAATVNGSPISNYEVLAKMNQQYRKQALDQLINEKIIADEARKRQVSVSQADIDSKISELEKNVGGPELLDSLLSQQGQTRQDLQAQVKLLLLMEKMYANEASVSAEEVSQFVEQNSGQLTATDSAGQTAEATEILKQQKLNQVYSQKFQQLKQNSSVSVFE